MKMFTILPLFAIVLSTAAAFAQELDSNMVQRWACYARNYRGSTYEGLGITMHQAQESAMARCYRSSSHSCEALSCRVVYLRSGD